jgi:hypothetical protein
MQNTGNGNAKFKIKIVLQNLPNTARAGQVRAFAHTFGILAPTTDSASGSFSRQFPHLPALGHA